MQVSISISFNTDEIELIDSILKQKKEIKSRSDLIRQIIFGKSLPIKKSFNQRKGYHETEKT